MTNRLELNWRLDGFVDEQRYYCSETVFTAETKPAPKATLANDVRSYIDTNIEVNKTYYVAVGSVKNAVEKLSTVASIYTENIVSFLHFDNDLQDQTGKIWLARGAAEVSSEASVSGGKSLKLSGGSIAHQDHIDFNFSNGNFKIEFYVNLTEFAGWGMAIAKRNAGANYSPFLIGVNPSESGIYFALSSTGTSWDVFEIFNSVLPANGWNKVELSRTGPTITGKVNNSKILERNIGTVSLMTNSDPVTVGANGNSGESMRGFIDELKITRN